MLDKALWEGRRGLPGGTTLARVLAEHRQAPNIYTEPPLAAGQILAWAEAHRAATGRWPSSASGPVLHAQGERWGSINTALREGYRGLPGGQSLGRLIRGCGGQHAYRTRPELKVEQILAWADAHREATGEWPGEHSGPVRSAPGETWKPISGALLQGHRGLPGGSSLARLLAEHRGARNPSDLPPLTIQQVLAWADAHRETTGRWPSSLSGPVAEGSSETWVVVDKALRGRLSRPARWCVAGPPADEAPAGATAVAVATEDPHLGPRPPRGHRPLARCLCRPGPRRPRRELVRGRCSLEVGPPRIVRWLFPHGSVSPLR